MPGTTVIWLPSALHCKAPTLESSPAICRSFYAILGCMTEGGESEYQEVVSHFVKWCGRNELVFNVAKTKEMVVGFNRRTSH